MGDSDMDLAQHSLAAATATIESLLAENRRLTRQRDEMKRLLDAAAPVYNGSGNARERWWDARRAVLAELAKGGA